MDVLLLNPSWLKREGNIWKKIAGAMPPLGIAYIASFLEKNSISVRIIDTQVEKSSLNDLLNEIKEEPLFIGITATTNTADNAIEAAKICREKFKKAKIVFGGVHPTVLPEDVLSNENVDYVIRGEGEESFLALIKGEKVENIKGLSYKDGNRYLHNPEGEMIKDLDMLPFPAYHLLSVKSYMPTLGSYKRLPAISMITSRGCPGKCTFCLGSYLGGKVRMHSTKYIVEEIKMLQKNYGIKEISFYDDTFTTFRHKVQEFCQAIIQEKIDITWVCFARVDFVDEKTLRLMKQAGCHQIMYGIESGNEQILKNIEKMISLSKAKDAVKLTKKVGIECRTTFMLGNPGETEETIKQTINFAKNIDPDIALFNITTPYPGTKMFQWAEENGYLMTKDWSKYDLSTSVMKLPTISSEKIEEYYKKSHKIFYSRPWYLFRRLFKIRNFNDIKIAFKGVLAVFQG